MKYAAVYVALMLLAGCAQLGLPAAQTFDQKLAYAYGTHTAVLQAATSAVQAHTLSPSDAEQVLKLADESRGLLDAAKAAGGSPDGINKLALASSVLTQLQTYLNSRSQK